MAINSDYLFLQAFLSGDKAPVPIASSPLAVLLNARLLEADAAGTAVLAFEPPETFIQGAGVLQGGTVTTMLDFALAFCVLVALPADRTCATATLTTNFMRPAGPGQYIARGSIDRLGSQVAFAKAVVHRADNGQTVATATAVMPLFDIR